MMSLHFLFQSDTNDKLFEQSKTDSVLKVSLKSTAEYLTLCRTPIWNQSPEQAHHPKHESCNLLDWCSAARTTGEQDSSHTPCDSVAYSGQSKPHSTSQTLNDSVDHRDFYPDGSIKFKQEQKTVMQIEKSSIKANKLILNLHYASLKCYKHNFLWKCWSFDRVLVLV